jgi:ribosomal-protein-alanine N-acetyltransferase
VRLGQEVQEVPRRIAVGSVAGQSPPTRPQAWARPAPPLSDGVVRLEPIEERFVSEFEALTHDPEVIRFTRVPARRSNDFAAGWIAGYVQGWAEGSRAGFAIVDVDDGAFLGMCGLIRIEWDASEAEIGYVVAPAARGRGTAGRSIDLISRWGLDELGLARIEAVIDVANEASLRVAERAGYRREGVRRSAYFKHGVRADVAIYSLLPGELP